MSSGADCRGRVFRGHLGGSDIGDTGRLPSHVDTVHSNIQISRSSPMKTIENTRKAQLLAYCRREMASRRVVGLMLIALALRLTGGRPLPQNRS